ncbi:MAG: grasp-with-spasm system ATP-grasp peptide maturase [Bacteroidota bacterium]
MILIISDENDNSTNDVIDWLLFYNAEFIRIHPDHQVAIRALSIEEDGAANFELHCNEQKISYAQITSVWYRRGRLKLELEYSRLADTIEGLDMATKDEIHVLTDFIHYLLSLKPHISNFLSRKVNKLQCLFIARQCGLSIPPSYLFTRKEQLRTLHARPTALINKPLGEVFDLKFKRRLYITMTEEITASLVANAPDAFLPSLFQHKIKKFVELRIFFLFDDFYPMAIFSQTDAQTAVDFRNYNYQKPNRNVPVELPAGLTEKLKRFTKEVKLNCGSIDMIVTPEDDYVFLEVNPVGQYGMVGFPCNYQLDKKIAEFLIQ